MSIGTTTGRAANTSTRRIGKNPLRNGSIGWTPSDGTNDTCAPAGTQIVRFSPKPSIKHHRRDRRRPLHLYLAGMGTEGRRGARSRTRSLTNGA